jgi:hypothetical protein
MLYISQSKVKEIMKKVESGVSEWESVEGGRGRLDGFVASALALCKEERTERGTLL